MRKLIGLCALLALLFALLALMPQRASAQTAWESPRLLSPAALRGTGLYYVRFATLPGDGGGAMLTLSPSNLPAGASVRLGATKGAGEVTAAFGGIDLTAPLLAHAPGMPLDVSWNAGAGVSVGQYVVASVPVGVAAGFSWSSTAAWLSPYVSARATMDVRFGEAAPEGVFDVSPGVDIGLDAAFDRARRFVVRFSTSLGDRSALAVGMMVRSGAPKTVED